MSTEVAAATPNQSRERSFVFLNVACRVILAAIFAISSIQKVDDPTAFQSILTAYHLGPVIVHIAVPLVPLFEFALSLTLVFGIIMRTSALATVILLGIYTILMVVSLITGNVNHGCGCFIGVSSSHSLAAYIVGDSSITIADVVRDLLFIAIALVVWFTRDPKLGLDKFWTNSRAYWKWYRGRGYLTVALIVVFVTSGILAAIAQGNLARAAIAPLSIAQDFNPTSDVTVGAEAPNFSLDSVNGTKYSLSQYHGKVVLLEFLAIWCSNCHEEAPIINQLEKEYPSSKFQVLSVISSPYSRNYETSNEADTTPYNLAAVEWYQHTFHVTNPILVDPHFTVTNEYISREYPNLIVINPQGQVKDIYIGQTPLKTLTNAVQRLVD